MSFETLRNDGDRRYRLHLASLQQRLRRLSGDSTTLLHVNPIHEIRLPVFILDCHARDSLGGPGRFLSRTRPAT